jgi:hypothetical protein
MNRNKIFIIGTLILLTCVVLFVIIEKGSGQLEFKPPENGIVPDEATAIKIAEVIGLPVFGKNISDYKPFHASLENDSIWHVYGLPKKTWFYIQLGGSPEFDIQKKDGKVLKVNLSR